MEMDKSLDAYAMFNFIDQDKYKEITKDDYCINTEIVFYDDILDVVTILAEFQSNYRCYLRYQAITQEEINRRLNKDKIIDLEGYYISDFDIKSISYTTRFNSITISAHYSYWNGKTILDNSTFTDCQLDFSYSYFNGSDLDIQFAKFINCKVDFWKAVFNVKRLSFFYSAFNNSTIDFTIAHFDRCNLNYNFSKIKNSSLNFNHAYFQEGSAAFKTQDIENSKINFNAVTANSVLFLCTTFDSDINLNFKSVNDLTLTSCVNKQLMRIGGVTKKLELSKSANLGHVSLDWDSLSVEKLINNAYLDHKTNSEESKAAIENSAHDFLLLKENYNKLGQYEWEDAAYRAYMNYSTKAIDVFENKGKWREIEDKKKRKTERKRIRKEIRQRAGKKIFNQIFGKISGYGTMPQKIIMVCARTLGICALLYLIALLKISYNFGLPNMLSLKDLWSYAWESIYFSFITFLTIGYAEIQPTHWFIRMISCAEGFLGLFFMSILTVTVMRKVLR